MNITLILSALLMGLTGSFHCVVMCGGASAAAMTACGAQRTATAWLAFHGGRVLGYALAGAAVASGVGVLERLGRWSPAFRPLWTMAHMAALGLGLWLLWKGRQPEWWERLGKSGPRSGDAVLRREAGWQRIHGPIRAAGVGLVWLAWPCGLLQSALLVAALANGPAAGAAVMAAFALASAMALGSAPVVWRWFHRSKGVGAERVGAWITRVSGLALAGASAWAMGHDLWVRVAAYCVS